MSSTTKSQTRHDFENIDDVSDDEDLYVTNGDDLPERLDRLIEA